MTNKNIRPMLDALIKGEQETANALLKQAIQEKAKALVKTAIKEDYSLWEITDTSDPHSEVYFSGTRQECEEWLTDNEHNDQFKNCEFDMNLAND